MYSANFTVYGKKVCLSLHYNGDKISKDFSSSNATGLCDSMILVSIIKPLQMTFNDIQDIHAYLMKKKQCHN